MSGRSTPARNARDVNMLLYSLPYSAYCAKVRIALLLKGLDFEETPPPDGYASPAYRAIAPAGTIPALDIGGRVLFESDAIIEYLNEIAPEPPLLPADPVSRAVARAAGHVHDGRIEPTVRALFPLIGKKPVATEAFGEAAKLLRDRLDRLQATFAFAPFIAGEHLTMGDLGYPGTLMMAECLLAEGGAEVSMPAPLADWRERLMDIPAVAETVARMADALNAWVAQKNASAA